MRITPLWSFWPAAALAILFCSRSAGTPPRTPISVQVTLAQPALVGQWSTLAIEVRSDRDAPGATVEVVAPRTAVVTPTSWTVDLRANSPVQFTARVFLSERGNISLGARALKRVSSHETWGEMSTVPIYAGTAGEPGAGTRGWKVDRVELADLTVPGTTRPVSMQTTPISFPSAAQLRANAISAGDQTGAAAPSFAGSPPPPGAAAPGTITLRGVEQYKDRSDINRVVDQQLIEIVRGDGSHFSPRVYCYTAADGSFSCSLPYPNSTVRVRLYSYTKLNNGLTDELLGVFNGPESMTNAAFPAVCGTDSIDCAYTSQTGEINCADGQVCDIGTWTVGATEPWRGAFQMSQDLVRSWKKLWSDVRHPAGASAGPGRIDYPVPPGHGTHAHTLGGVWWISIPDPSQQSADIVAHEYGHLVMGTLWANFSPPWPTSDCPSPHYLQRASGPGCALSEGWADFWAWYTNEFYDGDSSPANDGPVFNWPGGGASNMETRDAGSYSAGDQVEGNIAAVLGDLMDAANDGPAAGPADRLSDGIQHIWHIIASRSDLDFAQWWDAYRIVADHSPCAALDILTYNSINYSTGCAIPAAAISSASASPNQVNPDQVFSLQYGVSSTTGGNFMLGASARLSGTSAWNVTYPAGDVSVSIPVTSGAQLTRTFRIPSGAAAGSYDLLATIWLDTNFNGVIDASDQLVASLTVANAMTLLGAEIISTPTTPSGPGSGDAGVSYTYSTGGAASNLGHTIQYQYDWGDGTNSGWLAAGTTNASHSWAAGTYSVRAQARCATHNAVVSALSAALSVTITPPETVTTPTTPSGPASGDAGVSYAYSTGGAASNLGHTIQYQYDWGDGTKSGWLAVGTTNASHSWAAGTYSVRAQARCATHNAVVSALSAALSVTITPPETVTTPTTPAGPTSGTPGTSYVYSTGGATSNLGHTIQYLFDWGDGTNSGWLAVGMTNASHSWAAGTYAVRAQARCATHLSVVSPVSAGLSVTIAAPVPGDLDANGHPDLIWQEDATRKVAVWYLTGAAGNIFQSFGWIESNGVPGWSVVATADLNGDRKLDLIWQNDTTGQVAVWYMAGAQGNMFLSFGWIYQYPINWRVAAVKDLNGDGKPDVIWQNPSTGQVAVWYMTGANGNTFQSFGWIESNGVPGWTIVGAGDLNRDGKADLVWQNNTTKQVAVWYMTGAQGNVFSSFGWIYEYPMTWRVAGLGDLNGDGKLDIVWQNDARQVAVWYLMGPQGNLFQSFGWLSETSVPGWRVMLAQ